MKAILVCILFPFLVNSYCQTDSIRVEHIDLCPDLFRTAATDSTYKNYYVAEQRDTVYFENKMCVRTHLITTPYGIIKWRTKDGHACGNFQWVLFSNETTEHISGYFSDGELINGTSFEYYTNGQVKEGGEYKNGIRIGTWTWYTPEGEIEFQGEAHDGLIIDADEDILPAKEKRHKKR